MNRLLIICAVLMFFIRLSAQEQPETMTQKFFADPDFMIQTPTNQKPFEQELCTYTEMMKFLSSVTQNRQETVRLESLGKTPSGTEMPILYFGNGKSPKKLKIWLQGGLHGNEPGGSEGLFMLIDYLLHQEEGSRLLQQMDIAILPVANVDGYIAQKRVSSSGFDLNRDQTKFADPVSGIIKQAFIRWNPDAAFDFHEYQPFRKEYTELAEGGATGYYDVLFLPSGNQNIPECLRKMATQLFQQQAEQSLDSIGYSHSLYFSPVAKVSGLQVALGGKSPQSSSTSYALSNAVSMLIEIRGIGLDRTSFARRTNCCFVVAKSFLETASVHSEELKNGVEKAEEQTINRENNIVVIAEEPLVTLPVKFIDIKKNEVITRSLQQFNAMTPLPTLVRNRPWAYILPDSCKRELECLNNLGVETKKLKSDLTVMVDRYVVTDYDIASKEWERIYPVTVKTHLEKLKKTFSSGSIVVPMAQKNANYAAILLEPESDNGFVSFCITSSRLHNELPIYRVQKRREFRNLNSQLIHSNLTE